VGGWLLGLFFVLLGYGVLVGLLRLGALDGVSSKYVGGATLQLLLGNYSLLWTTIAGTLVLAIAWTVLLRLQARGWARLRRSSAGPRAVEEGRRWAALRQLGLLVGGVGAVTVLLLIVYQFGILPDGAAQAGLTSRAFGGVMLPFAAMTIGGVGAASFAGRRIQSQKGGFQLGFFGFEIPLLLALAFGLVAWFGMRQAVIVSANGVDTPGSLAPFNRAVRLFPNLATGYYLRGERRLANSDYENARRDFDKAAELDPSFPATYLARGRVLVQLDEPQAALNDAKRLIELRPDHPGGYAISALAKAKTGDLAGAGQDLTLATRPLPPNAQAWDAYFVRCLALAAVGRLDDAEADCKRVQELNPNHVISLDQLALIAFARGDAEQDPTKATAYYRQGIDYTTRVLKVEPKNAAAWTNRGEAYSLIGESNRDADALRQSDADLSRAIELNPIAVRALINRSLTRLYLDRADDARADAARAKELYAAHPKEATEDGISKGAASSNNLFIALYTGHYDVVVKEADALNAAGLSTTWVLSNSGLAHVELGDLQRGLDEINQALLTDKDYALAYDRRGYAYFLQGDLARAETDLDQAARLASLLDPEEQAELSYHRALLLEKQGRAGLASAELQQAIERVEVPSVRRQIEELQQQLKAEAPAP
jgi:tetratricopeptide (TPR) repeat protein